MKYGLTRPGGPTRKGMSHFFGRNKNCTRAIPQHVWLTFCRKDCRRSCVVSSKYRTENGVVRGWTVALRKRRKGQLECEKAEAERVKEQPSSDEEDDKKTNTFFHQLPRTFDVLPKPRGWQGGLLSKEAKAAPRFSIRELQKNLKFRRGTLAEDFPDITV
ncbi:hypothetical protein C8A03DRAFT_35208 [Achaetomium macrosporum]|uniref:Uncharacterized protein n=1 Tax=Achaetomium macrosporum TaxID=79813 RepID=A0AAN7C8D2_9PEZI|nr:hypothetical protein C8A03DRAFT_35208 [Achaetomium macrosporum]